MNCFECLKDRALDHYSEGSTETLADVRMSATRMLGDGCISNVEFDEITRLIDVLSKVGVSENV